MTNFGQFIAIFRLNLTRFDLTLYNQKCNDSFSIPKTAPPSLEFFSPPLSLQTLFPLSPSRPSVQSQSSLLAKPPLPPPPPTHYGTKPGHFETSKIHFPTSEGVSEVSERANERAVRANGRASDPLLTLCPSHREENRGSCARLRSSRKCRRRTE